MLQLHIPNKFSGILADFYIIGGKLGIHNLEPGDLLGTQEMEITSARRDQQACQRRYAYAWM